MLDALRASLGRSGERVALAIALALGVATCAIGFFADDWELIASLEDKMPLHGSAFDLYRFGTGDPGVTAELVGRGPWPWWTDPGLKIHLFRPLASALFALDHAAFGASPLGYHLHAIVWWLAVVAGARAVFRRALPPLAATVALVLFVLDDAHFQPIGWISARHVLVGSALALAGLAMHLRARQAIPPGPSPPNPLGRWHWRVLSIVGVGAGLLGSEAALGALGYWVAYELVGSRDRPRVRLAAACPALALAAVYLVAYKTLGYGASGGGLYIDPLTDPAGFARAALVRLPRLLGDLLLTIPASFPADLAPRLPLVAAGILLLAWIARWAWPSLSAQERASVRWLSLGTVLGACVGLAAIPGSRALLLPSVGAFGVLALLLERALLRGGAPLAVAVGATGLAALHGLVAPALLLKELAGTIAAARATERTNASLTLPRPWPKRVYVLAASDPMAAFYTGVVRAVQGPPDSSAWCILSMAKRDHRVTRTGSRSLRLEATTGSLFDNWFVDIYRSRTVPMRAGAVVQLDRATVRVEADDSGAPTSIALELDVPLDDPGIVLLAWQNGALRPISLAEGSPVEIEWTP